MKTIELAGEGLAAFKAYLAHGAAERKSFDALAVDRRAAIDAICSACRSGGKVTVTKESLSAWLKKEGASELRPAVVARLWPEPPKKGPKLSKKAVVRLNGLAGEIATAVTAVCATEDERRVFYRDLAKAVEAILKVTE